LLRVESIYEHKDYRSFLRTVLADRVRKNPAYSLRALARQLEVPCSQLSQALNGKARLSTRAARRISHKLELPAPEADYFCLWVEIDAQKDPEIRAGLLDRLRKLAPARAVQDLSVDQFKQIADWRHSAVLELVNLPGFRLTAESAARKLGISKLDAQVVIDRLERLEMLYQDPAGAWVRAADDLRFTAPARSSAMRSLYRQLAEKMSAALDQQAPFTERLSGYETIPMAREALPEAREAVDRFFEEMIRVARKYPKKTDVYNLTVHLFNLTPERK
jgi:uncharacterized protein (TIGR02147 family)